MGRICYTREQLLHLQDSPLVRKPDALPDITQWMEFQQTDQAPRKPRNQQGRTDEAEDSTAINQRPLFTSRPSRQNVNSANDIVLGPPKMSFTSTAKGVSRYSDSAEKGSDENTHGRERRTFGDRLGRDRENDRNRERNGYLSTRDGDADTDGWQTAKPRKSFGQEDGDRWQRNGDRHRERHLRNNDSERENRRNGEGRDRFDRRWTREDTPVANGEREDRDADRFGGWRDRDRPRREEREWGRGGHYDTRAEEVPEWMDEPVNESKQAKNVNDFEAWKAQQKAKQAGKPEEQETSVSAKPADQPKAPAPFGLSGKGLFGMYGEGKKAEAEPINGTATIKPTAKAKASKFADFFSREEEPIEAPIPMPAASPLPAANHTNEADKEGFNRILALLGKSNISSPPLSTESAPPQQQLFSPPPPDPQTPEFAQRLGRRSQNLQDQQDVLKETAFHTGKNLAPGRYPQHEKFTSPSQEFSPFSPVRNGSVTVPNSKDSVFDAPNTQRKPQMDANHAFLLNLMQSGTTSHSQQLGPMSPASDLNNNFVFPDNKPSRQQMLQDQQQHQFLAEHQGRMLTTGPPPGFADERHAFEAEMQRQRDMDRPRTEMGQKPSQRGAGPPGFYDDPPAPGLPRRQTDYPGRQSQANHMSQNMPRQMPPHADEFLKMGLPPGMQRPPQGQDSVGPPPGFGVGIPPGFAPPPPAGAPPPHRLPNQQQQRVQGIPGMFPQGPNMMPPPPPPGGLQGPPHGAGYFGAGPSAPPGFGRAQGGPNMPQLPPGMAMPPQGQRTPFDMMAEMQQRGGGRGGMGPYGL